MPVRRPPVADGSSADEVERQFYEAMQQGDIERVMAVWSDDEEIVCVHPGGARVVGALAIRASFEALFANGGVQVEAGQVRRVHSHATAVHSVVERLAAGPGQAQPDAWVVATNVYVRTVQGWRLVAHHASPGLPDELQEVAAATVLH